MSSEQRPPQKVDPDEVPTAPDPYPKMIIACIIIAVVLTLIVFGVLAWEMAQRSNGGDIQPENPRFQELVEQSVEERP